MGRLALTLALVCLASSCSENLWRTPDQRGAHAMETGAFADAADAFRDPMWRGVALYRAGEFEEAAASFGRTTSAKGAFNRGNALVFMGEYEDAIASYDRALELDPALAGADANRAIARARLDRLAPPEDDAGGTGGMLGADEIVFDDRAKNASETQTEVGEGDKLSDEELRALWLRRVETKPADFLRLKFAHQLAGEPEDEE